MYISFIQDNQIFYDSLCTYKNSTTYEYALPLCFLLGNLSDVIKLNKEVEIHFAPNIDVPQEDYNDTLKDVLFDLSANNEILSIKLVLSNNPPVQINDITSKKVINNTKSASRTRYIIEGIISWSYCDIHF